MNRAKTLVRTVVPRAPTGVQVRHMGGGHGHGGPELTGWQAAVRKQFPEDYQLVLAILGCYVTGGILYKLKPSSKKAAPAEVAAVASTSSSSTDVPSIVDDEFEKWAKIPGNAERWEKSVEEWAKTA